MATEAQPATQAKRILVVEDELMIRMLLEDMRSELGHRRRRSRRHRRGVGSDEERRLRPCDPSRRSLGPARLAGCRCPRSPRHAVRFCHGLWRGARALSGRSMVTKPFQMDGLKQMLQSAFG